MSSPGGPARIRLFVALPVPDEVRTSLIDWRLSVLARCDGLRAVAPDALHVTLCFLGSVSAEDLGSAVDGMGVAEGAGTAPLRVAEAVWLPARRPRVLGVSVLDVTGALASAQAALASSLVARRLYEPESRPFLPHVTVARARGGARLRAVSLVAPEPVEFVGSEVVLYRSRPAPGGSWYEALARVSLGAPTGSHATPRRPSGP